MINTILKTKFFVFSLIFFLCVASSSAFAITRTVTSNADDGSGGLTLREAIDASNNGDVIEFNLPDPSTIELNDVIEIEVSLTINGPGADKLTIDGNNDQIFFIVSDNGEITVNINGLRFTNGGQFLGGAIFNTQNLNVDSCVFEYNFAFAGGAIANGGGEEVNGPEPCILNVTNTLFRNNFAFIGGAIANIGTIQTIDNSKFIENAAFSEDGPFFPFSTFKNSQTANIGYGIGPGSGGAIANFLVEQVIFDQTVNTQTSNIIEEQTSGVIERISNSLFVNNFAVGNNDLCDVQTTNGFESQGARGGAIFNTAFIDVIERSSFIANIAFSGEFLETSGNIGCIENKINPQITNEGHFGISEGGAIYNGYVLHLIQNSTFYENFAENGGAIYVSGLIEGDGDGDSHEASTIIDFCTITNNHIDGFFLQNQQTAYATVESVGGIATGDSGIVGLSRSIVYDNDENDCDFGVVSLGNNIDSDGTCTDGVANDQSTNPMLDPSGPQNNGGFTPTIAILEGSPAIDGVNCDTQETQTFLVEHEEVFCETVNHDQRGFNRPVDGDDTDGPEDDIGAYEVQPEAKAKVTKITDPPGETGFMFEVTRMGDPTIVLTRFTLDDLEMDMTIIPTGSISISEDIPEDYEVAIDCSASTTASAPVVDNEFGTVDATIISSAEMIDCIFTNTFVGGTVIAPPTFEDDEEIIVTPGMDGPFAEIIVSPGISGGGRILIDLPEEVLARAASLIPDISECQIFNPAPQAANVLDPDIVCEINDFPAESIDVILDLCTQGDQSGVADAIVEVVSDSEPDENEEEIIEIILDQLQVCQISGDGDGDGDGDGNGDGDGGSSGCAIAASNTYTANLLRNFFVTFLPAIVGFGAILYRRKKRA